MRRLILALALVGLAASTEATSYYVRKTGDDTTGDGSTALPWLTVSKAVTTVSIGGGHTINVGAGTYQENTSSLGYLYLNRLFVAEVIIQSESGVASDVLIQGSSSTAYDVRATDASNVTLKNVTLAPRLATNPSPFRVPSGNATNIHFEGVTFTANNASGNHLILLAADTKTISGIELTNCTLTGLVDYAFRVGPVAGGTVNDITVSGGTITLTGGVGIYVYDASNVSISDVTVSTAGDYGVWLDGVATATVTNLRSSVTGAGAIPFVVGLDDDVGGKASSGVTVTGGVFTSSASHGFLLGALVDGATVTGVRVDGYDQGIVLKRAANVVVTSASVSHYAGGAFYMKGATDSTFQDSRSVSYGGQAIYLAISGVTLTSGGTYQRNQCVLRGSAVVYNWQTDGDGGTNVTNSNGYGLCGSGQFGQIRGTANVANLAAARAAWAAYGDGSNDSLSRAPARQFSVGKMGGIRDGSPLDCAVYTVGAGN
jgi:hypothetical protein